MNESHRIVIHDANALIDLVNGDLLGSWFKLHHKTYVTDFVINQITRQMLLIKPFVDAGLLVIVETPEEDASNVYVEISKISEKWGVGVPDASAFWLANKMQGLLLTGDRRLAIKARRDHVEVRGILWAIDELLEAAIIAPEQAIISLKDMIANGARLPVDECEKRMKLWSS